MYDILYSIVFRNFGAWIFVIMILLIIFGIKHTAETKPAIQASSDTPQKNNSSSMNVLLYVGSFFIVGSMALMSRDAPDVLPFILIIVTILTYMAGILLYRFVDYLRPVGIAFTYTAIVLFPFWYYVFDFLKLDSTYCSFLTILISLFAYIGATVGIKSKIAGWLSYLWLIMAGWSTARAIDTAAGKDILFSYAFFIWPLIVAFIPNLMWRLRVKWLPVGFRQATKALADFLVPVFLGLSLSTLLTTNIGVDNPALRTIVAVLALGNFAVSLAFTKKRVYLVALRLAAQAFLIFLIADIMNYSIIGSRADNATTIAMLLVWIFSFLAQAIVSFFVPQTTDSEKTCERTILIISLAGIALAPIMSATLPREIASVANIAASVSIMILGVIASIRFKNVAWCCATVVGAMAIPIELFYGLSITGAGWALFAIYATITAVFIAIYAWLHALQPWRALPVALTAAIIGGIACITFSAIEDWSSAGYFFTAVSFAAISLISKRRVLLEVSCYIGVLALAYLFESLYYLSAYGTPNPYSLLNVITNEGSSSLFNTRFDYIAIMRSINALTLGATMAGFSLARERNAKSTPRLIIAYILVTVSYPGTLLGTESTAHMVLSIVFIIAEIGFLIIGALTKRKWLVIASAIAATLMSLRLTSSLGNAVSLLIIGVVIIAIVIWQMVSNNKKPTQVEQPQQEQKAIEESSSTEEKTEEPVELKANDEEKEDK